MSDPSHPEGWRVARDLDDREWDDVPGEQELRGGAWHWPDAWTAAEAVAAMRDAREVAAQRSRA